MQPTLLSVCISCDSLAATEGHLHYSNAAAAAAMRAAAAATRTAQQQQQQQAWRQ